MNKYYIRFNPAHIKAAGKPWLVVEIKEELVKKFFLDSVDINVSSWTEKSSEDNLFWNIACLGYLTVENNNGVISESI